MPFWLSQKPHAQCSPSAGSTDFIRGKIQIQANHSVVVEIGGIAIEIRSRDEDFRNMLSTRYAGFLTPAPRPDCRFHVELCQPTDEMAAEDDLQVRLERGLWHFHRGDFVARWDPVTGSGQVRQSSNPYAIDSVFRIVHSLMLASRGGLLLHAASAVREGKAFLFSGVSGAGKTTISRYAPADVRLLTDEISYLRDSQGGFLACGTPFAGELAKAGENLAAPLDTLFFLQKGSENRIESMSPADALRAVMRNILFFTHDQRLVNQVFNSACKLIQQVPVRRLIFLPDSRVWEIIRPSAGVAA